MASSPRVPRRADARHNRAALLDSAARLFAERGPDVPLDAVARDAGVSIATLYRHFPHREALITETYRADVAALGDVTGLLDAHPAADALAAWVGRLVEQARTKRAIGEVMATLPVDDPPRVRETIIGALEEILAAGAVDGSLRADMDAEDVLAALMGLWRLPGEGAEWSARADRLAAFVVDGLRAP